MQIIPDRALNILGKFRPGVDTDIHVVNNMYAWIEATTPDHVRELKDTLREADRAEIEAYGFSAAKGLWHSYKNGMMNRTGIVDGKVIAVWGVGGNYMSDIGQPWLMTSTNIGLVSPLRFAKMYQREVYKMLEYFPVLVNYVDARYDQAVRLLSIVGFTIDGPEPIGKGIYRKFHMERTF